METAVLELILLTLRAGRLAVKQIELAGLESLPPEMRTALIEERDALNDSLKRLNDLGSR